MAFKSSRGFCPLPLPRTCGSRGSESCARGIWACWKFARDVFCLRTGTAVSVRTHSAASEDGGVGDIVQERDQRGDHATRRRDKAARVRSLLTSLNLSRKVIAGIRAPATTLHASSLTSHVNRHTIDWTWVYSTHTTFKKSRFISHFYWFRM